MIFSKEVELLTDAKIGKDISQKLVIGNLSRNSPKMVQSFLDINRHQIAGKVGFQSVFYFLDFVQSFQQGIIMPGVGHNCFVVPQCAGIYIRKQLVFQFLNANVLFCGQEHNGGNFTLDFRLLAFV